MNERIERAVNALKANNFSVIYAKTKADIVSEVKAMLPEGCTVSSGGSQTLIESGVLELIKGDKYNYLDRFNAENPLEIFKGIIGCNFYFTSSNAVTEKGELVNVDGFANRVSAIAFGPEKVVVIVGKNKIVENTKEAFLRIKRIAAPKNCVRLSCNTPCAKLGHCVSLLNNDNPDMTDGCASPQRICRSYLVSGRQKEEGRITVVISDEDLGY